jgi:hypothetical protein
MGQAPSTQARGGGGNGRRVESNGSRASSNWSSTEEDSSLTSMATESTGGQSSSSELPPLSPEVGTSSAVLSSMSRLRLGEGNVTGPVANRRRRRQDSVSTDGGDTDSRPKRRSRLGPFRRLTNSIFRRSDPPEDIAEERDTDVDGGELRDVMNTDSTGTSSGGLATGGHGPENWNGFEQSNASAQPSDESRDRRGDTTSESHAAMVARLLAIAASVTARTIVGRAGSLRGTLFGGSNGSRSADGGDGSFHGFLNSLHEGLLSSELLTGRSNSNGDDENGDRRQQNFFRMFRFPPSGPDGSGLVPVLIVGVRAVSADDGIVIDSTGGAATPSSIAGGDDGRATLSGGDGSRAGGGGFSLLDNLTGMGRRRQQHGPSLSSVSSRLLRRRSSADSGSLSESVVSSGGSTSNNNSADITDREDDARISLLDEFFAGVGDSSSTADPRQFADTSRSDDAEFDGSSMHSRESSSPRSRFSWIVYVVGGNYPASHPILLAPSLFTDSPTYEDLMVLESFLGQAKPPVATKEDVDAAGGDFVMDLESPPNGENSATGDQCLVCLTNYESGDVCRQLTGCGHYFHKDCIDQWLLTGRNNCPLCRGTGVASASSSEPLPLSNFRTQAGPVS